MSKGNTGRRRKDKEILFYIQPLLMNLDYKEDSFIGKKNETELNLKEEKEMLKMVYEFNGLGRNQIQKREYKTTKIKSFRIMIEFILMMDLFFQVISYNNRYPLIKYNISNNEIKIKGIYTENMLCSFYSFRSGYYLNGTYLNNFFQIKTKNILKVYRRNKLPKAVRNNNKPITIFNKFHEITKAKKLLNKFINLNNFNSKIFKENKFFLFENIFNIL